MDNVNMKHARNYHHGNLKEQLLNEALSLLDGGGPKAVGIRMIAKNLGVAHSAPANHFKNKTLLLAALNEKVTRHFVESVKSQIDLEKTATETIKHFSTIVLEYGLHYPNRYRLIWQSEHPLSNTMEEVYSALTGMLKPFADFTQIDVETQAIALWSLIHGYVMLRLDGHLQAGKDDVTGISRQRAILDVMLDGIKS